MNFRTIKTFIAASAAVFVISCGSGGEGSGSSEDSVTAAPADTADAAKIPDLKPKGAKPEWAPSITDNMLVVIEKLQSYNAPPIESLSAVEARKQPTPTKAVMDVMSENNIPMPP